MADHIDPNCVAGVDCEGCPLETYCVQRDSEQAGHARDNIADAGDSEVICG